MNVELIRQKGEYILQAEGKLGIVLPKELVPWAERLLPLTITDRLQQIDDESDADHRVVLAKSLVKTLEEQAETPF